MAIYLSIVCCLLIGIGLLGYAVKKFIESVNFVRRGVKTIATVVGVVEKVEDETERSYRWVFEYQTLDGVTIRNKSVKTLKRESYDIGDIAELFYLKESPRKSKINSFTGLWIEPLLIALLSAGAFGGAYIAFQAF